MCATRLNCEITFGGRNLLLDASGAAFWPRHNLLIVSDLHLEKASFLAQFGSVLPRHDTRDTLERLAAAIDRYRPQTVVCLGDSFHDARAHDRLERANRELIAGLVAAVPVWHWVLGNHDPALPQALPGNAVTRLEIDGLTLLHEPERQDEPQIIGHFHPKLRLHLNGSRVSGRVFAVDENLMVMPAFGAFTGGLDVRNPALASRFASPRYYLLYRDQVWKI